MKRLLLLLVFLLVSLSLNAQNFWEQTKGPFGGTVYALAINSGGNVFAGLVMGYFVQQTMGITGHTWD